VHLVIQLVDIFYPNVFKRYSAKYNIFRDLYEKDLLGIEIRGVDKKLGHKIKKIILSNKEICYINSAEENGKEDLLALGSYGIFKELAKEIISMGNEDLGFKISHIIQNITEYDNRTFQVSNLNYTQNRSYVMGILNVTPDSFSDGGKYFSKEAAVNHGINLVEQGADFIDIGGESTRPGSDSISEEEELKRVIPVTELILKHKPNTIISVDTTKAKVAEEALKIGAKIVNDISSCSDPKMIDVIKKYSAAVVLMHMKGNPKNMQDNPTYDDVVSEVYDYLINKCDEFRKAGIRNIFIDPGIGFGKRVTDNYELLKRLNEFKGIGYPIFVGLSRKSFIGKAFNLSVEERENPTLAAETLAIKNGAKIIRTHGVKKTLYASKINFFIENPDTLNNV
jgi:dihydropteroate synthase